MSTLVNTGIQNGTGAGAFRTSEGTTAMWVAFALTFTSTVIFFFLSMLRNVKPEARLTYYLVTLINAITAGSYLIQALNASDDTPEDFSSIVSHNNVRTFEWLRYVAWALCAPISAVVLGLLAGAHWTDILFVAFSYLLSVASLFAAALNKGEFATWPLYTMSSVAMIPVYIGVLYTFRAASYKVHPEIGKLYTLLAYGAVIAFSGYSTVWGVSEGGHVTTQDQEIITYAVLDIFTKSIFGFVLIYSRESIARYGSYMGAINTGQDFDFPIARATYTGSGSDYVTQPSAPIVIGEHRDTAFAQLRQATGLVKSA